MGYHESREKGLVLNIKIKLLECQRLNKSQKDREGGGMALSLEYKALKLHSLGSNPN